MPHPRHHDYNADLKAEAKKRNERVSAGESTLEDVMVTLQIVENRLEHLQASVDEVRQRFGLDASAP